MFSRSFILASASVIWISLVYVSPFLASPLMAQISSLIIISYDASGKALEDKEVVSEASEEAEDEYPDGGLQAWLAVLGSFLISFAPLGLMNAFGSFQEFYSTDYLSNYSESTIAFIGTIEFAILYTEGIIIGPIFDSYGLKYTYPIGCVGTVLSMITLSFTRPQKIWQQFLTQGVLFGLAGGFAYNPALAVVGQYFKRRRGFAMCIVVAGSSLGGVCFPIMFTKLFKTIGFAWAMRVTALITLVCYVVAILITRARLPPKPMKRVRELVDFEGYKDSCYTLLAIGSFVVSLGLYSPFNYLQPFAAQWNVPSSVHDNLLSIMNGASIVGRLIGGPVADKFGLMNILSSATFLSGVVCVALWLPAKSSTLLIVFACLYGMFSGVFVGVSAAAIAQISPREKIGARIGAYLVPTAIATLVGTPLGGAFVSTGSPEQYQHVAIFSGAVLMAGSLILYAARVAHCKDLMARL